MAQKKFIIDGGFQTDDDSIINASLEVSSDITKGGVSVETVTGSQAKADAAQAAAEATAAAELSSAVATINSSVSSVSTDVSNLTTDDIAEGSNLYYTDARAVAANASDIASAVATAATDATAKANAAEANANAYTDTAIANNVDFDGYATEVYVDSAVASIPSETTTSISINANVLSYVDEEGNTTNVDLSLYLDDSNLSRIASGSVNPTTGIATFTRDDATSFTVDFSALLDDTNLVTSVNGQTGAVTVDLSGKADLTGATFTGTVTATSFVGDGSGLTNLPASGISNVVEDTSPQLGGDLDAANNDITNVNDITSTYINSQLFSQGKLYNNSLGIQAVGVMEGVSEISYDSLDYLPIIKSHADQTAGIELRHRSGNHVRIKAPDMSSSSTYTLTLPDNDGTSGQVLTTDGSGSMTWQTVSSSPTFNDVVNATVSGGIGVGSTTKSQTGSSGDGTSWLTQFTWTYTGGDGAVNARIGTYDNRGTDASSYCRLLKNGSQILYVGTSADGWTYSSTIEVSLSSGDTLQLQTRHSYNNGDHVGNLTIYTDQYSVEQIDWFF